VSLHCTCLIRLDACGGFNQSLRHGEISVWVSHVGVWHKCNSCENFDMWMVCVWCTPSFDAGEFWKWCVWEGLRNALHVVKSVITLSIQLKRCSGAIALNCYTLLGIWISGLNLQELGMDKWKKQKCFHVEICESVGVYHIYELNPWPEKIQFWWLNVVLWLSNFECAKLSDWFYFSLDEIVLCVSKSLKDFLSFQMWVFEPLREAEVETNDGYCCDSWGIVLNLKNQISFSSIKLDWLRNPFFQPKIRLLKRELWFGLGFIQKRSERV